MTFEFPTPQDDSEQKLIDAVHSRGWHVSRVVDDDGSLDFAYTVGLTVNYQHPEVIILGLPLELMHLMLNGIGEEIKNGRRFEPGKQYSEILESYNCAFISVAPFYFRDYLGYALWFYRQHVFEVVQCVWPDREGMFPWQGEPNPNWHFVQPLLDL